MGRDVQNAFPEFAVLIDPRLRSRQVEGLDKRIWKMPCEYEGRDWSFAPQNEKITGPSEETRGKIKSSPRTFGRSMPLLF